ncbi:MAG: hypothetical protein JO040_00570 [Gemmatimonadetes bacterium]|nr:hypothetical protein [Gemmatimonadota bacterium]
MALNRVGTGSTLPPLPEWSPRTGTDRRRSDAGLPAERRTGTALDEPPLGHSPPGTDPGLWGALSPEERSFFARIGGLGPLTYGRTAQGNASPVFRGLHLDVTV